jgi:hypothetical protein
MLLAYVTPTMGSLRGEILFHLYCDMHRCTRFIRKYEAPHKYMRSDGQLKLSIKSNPYHLKNLPFTFYLCPCFCFFDGFMLISFGKLTIELEVSETNRYSSSHNHLNLRRGPSREPEALGINKVSKIILCNVFLESLLRRVLRCITDGVRGTRDVFVREYSSSIIHETGITSWIRLK